MAATPKPVRKAIKKMGTESRAAGKGMNRDAEATKRRLSVKKSTSSLGKKLARKQYN